MNSDGEDEMTLRQDIVDNAQWGKDNEGDIHYSQGARRFNALQFPRSLPLYTDCSAFATLCYAWAGAPDPNGHRYDGTGFTGSLLDHCEHISHDELQPADLVVFGPYPGDHVVIVTGTDPDPMCVSHGQEAGPILIRLSREVAAHRPPIFYLRGEGLDIPPEDEFTMDAEARERFDAIDLELKDIRNQIGESNGPTQTGLAGAVHKDRLVGKAHARKDGMTDAEITAAENG